MACCLTATGTPGKFNGTTGCTVTLDIRTPEGGTAKIVTIKYDDDPVVSAAPFQFTVKKDPNDPLRSLPLSITVESANAGTLIEVFENCQGGGEVILAHFHFDPTNPAFGRFIVGV